MGCGLDSLSGTLTSSESPDITRAQSCFLLKALSSRWASPRVVTYTNGNHTFLNALVCPNKTL